MSGKAVDGIVGSDTVLEFDQVSLTLGQGAGRTDALVDVNLSVEPGELVAITGRSGSGKSSLLNLAGGLYTTSSGAVRVDGVDLSALSPKELAARRRRSVGFVFQDLNLIASLTAAENISLPLELDGMRPGEARTHAETALEAVELDGLGRRFPDQLSGGQRQRVAIARGLVGERRLLLADEPTGALDEVTGEAIMEILRRRCDDGAAALLVTHDPSIAAWGDRVVRLRDGRIDSVTERPTVAANPLDWQAS
jgi:putative ABC transport system ATP-binding protein